MAKGGCTWKLAFIVLGIVAALLTVVTVALGTVLTTQQDSIHRIAVELTASNVFPAGAGELGYRALCLITLDENSNAISFRCRMPPGLSGVTALHIRGPILLGSPTWSGGVAGVLCGALIGPGDGCDTLVVPGEVSGFVQYQISDNLSSTGVDVRPLLHEIRRNPDLFYLEMLTNNKPVSPGALRGPLTQFTGWQ